MPRMQASTKIAFISDLPFSLFAAYGKAELSCGWRPQDPQIIQINNLRRGSASKWSKSILAVIESRKVTGTAGLMS